MTKLTNEVVHISVTVWARAKRRTVQSSPRGRDCEKCCFFRTRASWLCVNFSSMTKLTNEVVHISVTVWARAKRRTVQSSPRGRDCEKCCFFRTRASWLCVNFSIIISMTKLTNEVVHISVTVWARAKRRTVQSSPRGRDCEKCCFFRTRASWLCVNFSIQSVWQNWQMKWCISQ